MAGFGDPVVLLVAGLLLVGEMLDRTGVAQAIGNWVIRVGGGRETRLLVLIMLAAAVLSSVMSSTAVVAIFIPIVFKVSSKTGIGAGRLLLPMSYAAMISGMLTLIATPPNLVVSGELEKSGYDPLGFFSFSPIGGVMLVAAIVYVLTIGRRFLCGDTSSSEAAARPIKDFWADYGLEGHLHRLRIASNSPLAGTTICDSQISSRYRVWILGVERTDRFGAFDGISLVDSQYVLQSGQTLLVAGKAEDAARFQSNEQLEPIPETQRDRQRALHEYGVGVVLIHPECRFIGKTIRDLEFRSRYDLQVVGIRRSREPISAFEDTKLASGDTLLVAGTWTDIARLKKETHDFVLLELPIEFDEARQAHRKAPIAIAILVGMVLLSLSGWMPVVTAVLIAAMCAIMTRCLSVEEAYRSISWSSLVLLAGMLPVAVALQNTGGTDLIVEKVVGGLGSAGPYAMMSLLFWLTAGLSLLLSNTATAVVLVPVAIQAAKALEVSPYPFAIVVLIGASSAFASPVASPVVTLVMQPGRYTFMDFVKLGAPLMVIAYLITLLITPLLFPL